jgi:hypothetical protein
VDRLQRVLTIKAHLITRSNPSWISTRMGVSLKPRV